MPTRLLMLGLLTMLVGCASAYGEEASSASGLAESSVPAKPEKETNTEKTKTKPAQAVDATEPVAPTAAVTSTEAPAATTPTSVTVTWKSASATARYSFDVFLKDGTWVGPCKAVEWIGKSLTTTFDGACPSSDEYKTVALSDVDDFMVCSAENDDWDHPICTHADWNGVSANAVIAN